MTLRNLIAIVSAAVVGLLPSLPLVAAPVSPAHLRVLARKNVAAGGPTLIAEDNFDSYADEDDLGAQANWTNRLGITYIEKPASDGAIRPSGATLCYWDADAFASDQRAEATMDAGSANDSYEWAGVAVRIQTGANTGYALLVGSGDLFLYSVSAGTWATINSDTAITVSSGTKIALEVSGAGTATRIKVQLDTGGGWVDKWTDQNPSVDIDNGYAGVTTYIFGASANTKIDDWKGYDL